MALSDWDIYKNHVSMQASIDITTPLAGQGSLRLGKPTNYPAARVNLVSKGVTYAPVGLLAGAIAACMTFPTTFTVDNNTIHSGGICCLQSQRDLVSAQTGTAYTLQVERTLTSPSMTLILRRWTGGLIDSSQPTPIWSAAVAPIVPLGMPFTVELQWEAVATYGGTRLVVRRGTQLDYTDLLTVVDLIHPFNPVPTSSAGEGPFYLGEGTTSNSAVLFDNWRVRGVI